MDEPPRLLLVGLGALLVLYAAGGTAPAFAADLESVKRLFADPPREYSTAPLWVWNDALTEEQVLQTLRDLRAQNIRQAFVHPRPGLVTPYLGEEWFALWRAALGEAERLDMNLWIYDENSYPSGFAGGHVPERMPEARGRGLALNEADRPPADLKDVLAVFLQNAETGTPAYTDITAALRAGEAAPAGRFLIFSVARAPDAAWHGGRCYVDLLHPGVTQAFLDVTLKPYEKAVGREFGRRVPGTFTDEPQLRPAGGLPWTDDLPQQFEQQWGYPLLPVLPSLIKPVGDWRRVRHNYHQTLLELFIERWARPYYEYCERKRLEFTGHYWEHEWPHCGAVPDNMAMSAWQQRPGIDCLMNEYDEGPQAQFGNVRAVLEIASVANQLGRARTLCEAYGAGGWDLRLADMKRIGDWLYVLGVNTLDEHLSYVSIRGARKRDHPQSFSYHEPWWEAYGVSAAYFARLSAALSQGEQVNRILVLEPTTTAWMYQMHGGPELNEVGQSFQKLVVALAKAQVEFDLGCEDVLARHGANDGDQLVVGRRSYDTVVLPPHTENVNRRTAELLEHFVQAGGRVLCCGAAPARVDGRATEWGPQAAEHEAWRKVQAAALAEALRPDAGADFALEVAPRTTGPVYHHRRRLRDGQILFVTNTSLDQPARGALTARAGGIERLDAFTGRVDAYAFREDDGDRLAAEFELPPCGSLLLLLTDKERAPGLAAPSLRDIEPEGPPVVRRVAPNVLVLDFVDLHVGGEAHEDVYVLKAAQRIFQKHGLPGNPWEGAVQFEDELIRRKFPAGSGFAASYTFEIRERVPDDLQLVLESTPAATVTCNDRPVKFDVSKGPDDPRGWWLERSFRRAELAGWARVGENVVTISVRPLTMTAELEAAYLLGDFRLVATERGFAVAPAAPLDLAAWNEQGCPFYSAGVSYTELFELPATARPAAGDAAGAARWRVGLRAWYGSAAKVLINGRHAGYITCPPWECDVSPHVQPGRNEVEVIVYGTLKNTLGPHHGNPPLGKAWPPMFHQAPEAGPPPGTSYTTVRYGLFESFVLREVSRATGGPAAE